MLIAKISFYFESAKKTGEKLRKNMVVVLEPTYHSDT